MKTGLFNVLLCIILLLSILVGCGIFMFAFLVSIIGVPIYLACKYAHTVWLWFAICGWCLLLVGLSLLFKGVIGFGLMLAALGFLMMFGWKMMIDEKE